jgi:hypothetical protein
MNARKERATATGIDRGPELDHGRREQGNVTTGVGQFTAQPAVDVEQVQRSLELLQLPGATFEVRPLFAGRHRPEPVFASGYFRDPGLAARALRDYAGQSRRLLQAYVTLNPVDGAAYSRRAGRLDAVARGAATADAHILKRSRLLVDLDAERIAGISSSNLEHEAALSLASEIDDELRGRGWPAPLRADSGNGAHLVYGIDLPSDDDGLVKRVLEAAEARFGTTVSGVRVKVDTSVHNPSRISKLYGTIVRKGDNTIERPHRVARILRSQGPLEVISREALEAFANEHAPRALVAVAASPALPPTRATFDVERWLDEHGIRVARRDELADRTLWVLDVCPFNADHSRGEAHVHRMHSGQLGAACKHESCKWGWLELRERFEPKASRTPAPATAAASAATTKLRAKLVTASDVVEEHVEWLWQRRIPLKMITFLDGDPGLGKSTLTADLAARVSRGQHMPFELPPGKPAADVIFMATEDVKAMTSVPRLRVAGADLTRVRFVESMPTSRDPDAPPTLDPERLEQLEAAIAEHQARLVVIDPLFNYLPTAIDAHRDQDVRSVLKPLAAMAERLGCAIVIVRHLKKGAGSALNRGSGSIGLAAAARSVLLLAKNAAEQESPLYLAQVKSSVGEFASTLAWRIVPGDGAPKVKWEGEVTDVTADHLAQLPEAGGPKSDNSDDEERTSTLDECKAMLRTLLADGPRPTNEVQRDLREALGVSPRTIARARAALGIVPQVRTENGIRRIWIELPGWQTLMAAKAASAGSDGILQDAAERNQLTLHADLDESKDAKAKDANQTRSGLALFPAATD